MSEQDSANAARRRLESDRFVGRRGELEKLHQLLARASAVPCSSMLLGPPGIGKTTLARRFSAGAALRGHDVAWVSGESTAANPAAFLTALGDRPLESLGRGELASVLVVDAFEKLEKLESWLFEEAIWRAGPRLLVLLTSRQRLPARRQGELAFGSSFTVFELAPFGAEESRDQLARLGVPRDAAEAIVDRCKGHPLSLALEALRSTRGAATGARDGLSSPLAADLLRDAPSPLHARGLCALCMVRVMDPPLLAAVLERDAGPVWDWLSRSSFVDEVRGGLVLHSLVRDALFDHLATRELELHASLGEKILEDLVRRMAFIDPSARHQLSLDALYARRSSPLVRDYFAFEQLGETHIRVATPDDREALARAVGNHEGSSTEQAFRTHFSGAPAGLHALCSARPLPEGAIGFIELDPAEAPPAAVAEDPIVCAALAAISSKFALCRWFFCRSGYQTFGAQMTALMTAAPFVLPAGTRRVAFAMADPERWGPLSAPFLLVRLTAVPEVEIGARRYGLFVADLQQSFPDARDPDELTKLTLGAHLRALTGLVATQPGGGPGRRMDRADFEKAVHEALASLHQSQVLTGSPLCATALVPAGTQAAGAALKLELVRALDELAASPGYAASAELLRVTYFEEPRKQEAAAAILATPYGTYRYRLRKALALFTETLATREAALRTS